MPPEGGDDHFSRVTLAGDRKRPTRGPERGPRDPPTRSSSRWGLPCRPARAERGGLLPHRFILTVSPGELGTSGGLFSVALSLLLRTVGVTHHLALRSPDFPPAGDPAGGRPGTRRARCYSHLVSTEMEHPVIRQNRTPQLAAPAAEARLDVRLSTRKGVPSTPQLRNSLDSHLAAGHLSLSHHALSGALPVPV